MRDSVAEDVAGLLLLVILAVLITWALYGAFTKQQCLSLGWRDSAVTWNLQQYCIREENEYEITRLLADIIQEQGAQE